MTEKELKAVLAAEIKWRKENGYIIIKKTNFEIFVKKAMARFQPGGWLIIVKPDGKLGVYAVAKNPFKDPESLLPWLRNKFPIGSISHSD